MRVHLVVGVALALSAAVPMLASAATPTCVVVAKSVQVGLAPHGPQDCLPLA